jgi:hypothetical protein
LPKEVMFAAHISLGRFATNWWLPLFVGLEQAVCHRHLAFFITPDVVYSMLLHQSLDCTIGILDAFDY